ncbi:MAG TPA: threonine/serine dehydratase [Bryobacteraceae bacterium]|nr:threonine/serine dehydratase [Bryobacteraceae bacterium]
MLTESRWKHQLKVVAHGQLATLIDDAASYLQSKILETPVEPSPMLSRILGVPVWLKLESLQLTGSFKIRGAWFRLSRLTTAERACGILTCSAGNHGKAVAYAAKALGIRATVCVPSSVDGAKFDGMTALGADVRKSEFPGYDDTEVWARDLAEREGKPFISPFDDLAIMAGNGGTLAGEVLNQAPEARIFVVPVGGGGLSAGFAYTVKARQPNAILIGCQHELSPGLKLSLEAGQAITRLPAIETVAGGVEGGIGELPFEVLRSRIDHVALVSEEAIFEGVRWMLREHQYLIEPSAAVTIAACLTGSIGQLRAPTAIVISGRNVSLDVVRRILS